MAQGSSRGGRKEPRLGAGGGVLDMRLTPADRPAGGAVKRSGATTAKSRPRTASGGKPATPKRPAGTSSPKGPRGPRGGASRRRKPVRKGRKTRRIGFGRLLKRGAYWSAVLGIWALIAVVGVLGYYAAHLPPTSEWQVPQRPPNVRIVSADGILMANRGDTGGEAVRLEQLPPYLPQAVIAIEDRRFRSHPGLDPIGLARAMVTNLTSGRLVQGGSTLTQQLAKNLFLQPDRTLKRKVQEAILAVWLEASYSKDEILEMYLNRVYFGAGAYGVDAAARRYFGKSARMINLAEAATIAGLLKAPSRYAPTRNPDLADERAGTVLMAMAEEGYITAAEARDAIAAPTRVVTHHTSASENYVADWVMDLLPGYVGAIDQDITVSTTIDLGQQIVAEDALRRALAEDGAKRGVKQGAVVTLDGSGAVKALVGGRDYAASQFNRAVNARRQPGSAFKPFVYLAALESGLTPDTVRVDEPIRFGKWTPRNYSKSYQGPVTLARALALSINTVAARLAQEVGPRHVIRTARRLGITSPLAANLSLSLGTSEVTPLEIAAAYVPFSNGGYGVVPHVIHSIRGSDGTLLYSRTGGGPGRVIEPGLLASMNGMMADTLTIGTGRKAQLADRPAGGKTGTSQDFRDGWFIGYTGTLTTAVWLGNDDNSPTKRATGGSLPAKIWKEVMSAAHQGLPVAGLPGVGTQPVQVAKPTAGVPVPARRDRAEGDPERRLAPMEGGSRSLLDRIFGG
ncbi:transglycosylase domain-containing protein [Stappia indica]|uniref:transglycosylase domain-containing protein n=1 Tax=Stappia indica TaxID=538381 RepID=UPI001CD7F235|nr:PBP1A family penicillin-binding protein [Stappia indica]MCA1299601.1 PBP1A family penicillin-binding protein [Stappia indica]